MTCAWRAARASRHAALCVVVLLSACTSDCACGAGSREAELAKSHEAPPSAASAASDGAAGAGAAASRAIEEVFPDLADPAFAERLREQQRVAERGAATVFPGRLMSGSAAAAFFPARIAGLSAGEMIQGPTQVGPHAVSVLATSYEDAGREIYLKISDTAQAPFMRAPVLTRLGSRGSAQDAFLHGRVVAGAPAVLQYAPDRRSSQLMALVKQRYLVEVRISEASSPDEAKRVFEALPLERLDARN